MPIKVTCKNMLKQNMLVGNYYIHPSTGALTSDARTTSFKTFKIPVDCHKSYTVSGIFSLAVYTFYSGDTINTQNLIGQPQQVSYNDNNNLSRVSFVVPPSENTNAKYLVFSLTYLLCTVDNPDYQIEEGLVATPYVPPETIHNIARIIRTDSSGQPTEITKVYRNNVVVWSRKSESHMSERFFNMANNLAYLINKERSALGRGQLYVVPYLNECAAIKAEELSELYHHNRPDGTYFTTVIDLEKLVWLYSSENIASGSSCTEKVIEKWKNSSSEWKTVTNNSFTHIGIGVYYDENSADKF